MDVRILGALEVTKDGRPVDLGLRQARTLFAVLALQAGSPVRSAQLAEALWPGGPPPRWEATVRSHVSRLRRALEPDRPARAPSTRLSTRGDAYVLHLAEGELDAARFERLAADGRAALAREDYRRAEELLGRALGEWRGPVLADQQDPARLAPEVNRLEELRLLTMEQHAEAALALGDHARAVADLETLVAANPLRERCWELLLLALYRSGRQAEALRRYQEVRQHLVGDLGIEPGPELRALESAILRQDADLAPPQSVSAVVAPADVALPVWLRAPADAFVGRTPELDAVRASFKRAADGERRLALISGEPGIGKTRLVREACRDLLDAGALTLGGRCVEAPLHVLQPFAEVIDRLAVAQGERLVRDAPGELAALAGLVPALAGYSVVLPSVDAEAHRYLLFRAVASLLDADALGRPIVVVLDDLQWAAPTCLQLLAHLLRDERGGLLVLATTRDTEPTDELMDLVADLQRSRLVDRIRLAGLSSSEVGELATARGFSTAPADVFALTEGNPFFVEELVRHVAESGGELTADAVPDSVRDTIARRLLRLPPEARKLLGIAALTGSEFRLDVLARSADVDIDAADDALVLAARAGIVTERSDRAGTYGFSHALIQAVLREGLGAARRARVHRRVGKALAALDGPDSEIARHLLAAADDGSDVVPGIEAALTAAEAATARYAYDDAAEIVRWAWNALTRRAAPDRVLMCRVAVAFAGALRKAGLYDERVPLLEEAWTMATEIDDVDLRTAVVDEGLLGTAVPTEPWPSRAEVLCAELDKESDRRIVLAANLAWIGSARAGRAGEEARQLAEWALARVSKVGTNDRCTVLGCCFMALVSWSPVERVVDLARQVLAAARESGDYSEMVGGLSALRYALLTAGDLAGSDEAAREYEELARAVRLPRFMAGIEQRRAMRALLAGRFAEAEAHANEAVRLLPTPEFIEGLAVQLFALRLEQGRLGEVRDAVEAWAAQSPRAAWSIGLATLLAESGDLAGAAGALREVSEARFQTVPRDDLFFLALGAAAATAYLVGDRQAAGTLYELLAPHASRVIVAGEGAICWGSIHRLLGPLSALLGDVERAAMHFEAAMSVHERMGALPFLARDRLAYATVLRSAGGDPLRIDDLSRTGLALAIQLGMRGVIERFGSSC